MKPDLATREEIERMVQLFYEKVNKDELIAFFFKDVVAVDWEKHLPIMYGFWESIILGSNSYSGNPIQTHVHLNSMSKMTKEHFDRWLKLFQENLAEHFEGKYTEIARQRALSIATVMQVKLKQG